MEKTVSPDRDFVIINNTHRPALQGCLLFWGRLTDDGEPRSVGGYTHDFDGCERYSLDEIKREYPSMPVFGRNVRSLDKLRLIGNAAIRIRDMKKLKHRPITAYVLF